MPANAGIQVRFQFKFKSRPDSALRWNDGTGSELPVEKFRSSRFGANDRSVPAGIRH
jgi:hypothetical protein